MSQGATVYIYEFEEEAPSLILRGETLSDALSTEYSSFPEGAYLYEGHGIYEDKRIAFLDEDQRRLLSTLTGEFTVYFSPKDPVTAIVGGLLSAVGLFAVSSLFTPPVPNVGGQGKPPSSNNSLTERENNQRLGGLIPEIFGTVRATPDLIQRPYSVYVDQEEVEYSVMCLGRGRYHVEQDKIYDDTTIIRNLSGTAVDIYAPNQSPNYYNDTKQIGVEASRHYDDVPWNVKKCNAVNGQEVEYNVWSESFVIENKGINNVILNFVCPQGVYSRTDVIYNHIVTLTYGISPVDENGDILSGYTEQVGETSITGDSTSNPGDEAPDATSERRGTVRSNIYQSWWEEGSIGVPVSGGVTEQVRDRAILAVWAENIDPSTPLWICRIRNNDVSDPVVGTDRGDQVIIGTYDGSSYGSWGLNFESADSATNLYPYKDQRPTWVTVYKETSLSSGVIDSNSNEKIHILIDYRILDDITSASAPVEYSAAANPPNDYLKLSDNIHYGGGFDRVAVRVKKNNGNSSDPERQTTTKLKELFTLSSIQQEDFGDVTTVYTKTVATEGALALKKRKLNMVATRALRLYNEDGDYININSASDGSINALTNAGAATVYAGSNPPYFATNRVDHILMTVLRDSYIGNIPLANIDVNGLYNLTQTMSSYFASGDLYPDGTGTNYPLSTTATAFNYTFDKPDMSVEEMINIISSVCNMTPYREMSKFKFSFEGSGQSPIMLFNHRNKVPDSNVRSITFGSKEAYNGVQVDWANPDSSDSLETLSIPHTGLITNPFKVDLVGIRNKRQAFRHAYRAFYSIQLKSVVEEFEASEEAQILVRGQKIYSSDNTRPNVYDGEIESVSGSILELSQPCDLSGITDPYIFIQHKNATTQSLPITQGVDDYHVVFTGTLSTSLVTDASYYAQTPFQIWGASHSREQVFIVDERTPSGSSGTQTVKASVSREVFYIADKITFWLQPLEQRFLDRSPNERHPIPKGGMYIPSTKDSQRGYCVYNTNPASFMKFDTGSYPSIASSFTMMAWVKMVSAGSTRPHFIFITTNGTSFKFYVQENAGTYTATAERNGASTYTVTQALTDATTSWNHIVVTFNGTSLKMKLYVNGVEVDEETVEAMTATRELYVAGNNGLNGFKGYLDGLILSYDVVSSEAIRDFYLFEKNLTSSTKY